VSALIETGTDRRLAENEPLERMLEACEQHQGDKPEKEWKTKGVPDGSK
jgi:hypothetical protein